MAGFESNRSVPSFGLFHTIIQEPHGIPISLNVEATKRACATSATGDCRKRYNLNVRLSGLIERALSATLRSSEQEECYSQEGEDLVAARLLGDRENGFYVDVGAHHPMRHSNTYLFYRRGWRGINIDATPGSMAEFQRLRPRDINIERLVASESSSRRFYVFNEPALNTASDKLARERPAENAQYRVDREIELRSCTLASLLDEFMPRDTTIDLMSVDVEGLDLDVLCSNDWERYRPNLLLVELLRTELVEVQSHEITCFLRDRQYRPVAKLYNTVIFQGDI
jgi:FkbM family methyltransferase